jgi:beta-galactosidase
MLNALVRHYAVEAGIIGQPETTIGTVVIQRTGSVGGDVWVIVNMDGCGGRITLPFAGRDMVNGHYVKPGILEIGRYEYRIIGFENGVGVSKSLNR